MAEKGGGIGGRENSGRLDRLAADGGVGIAEGVAQGAARGGAWGWIEGEGADGKGADGGGGIAKGEAVGLG